MIQFSDSEKAIIARLKAGSDWKHDDAEAIKARIKPLLISRAFNCCCYCLRSMYKWHKMTIDIEHILPKGKYPELMFVPDNLSTACKRCNMNIKGTDDTFYLGNKNDATLFKSEHYSFVHPNADLITTHLHIVVLQVNTKEIIKYSVVNDSPKGHETYRYFKLKDLEVNSFDEAQGLKPDLLIDALPTELAQEVKAVLNNV